MADWFSDENIAKTIMSSGRAHLPVPTQVVSNGEWLPYGQTPQQREVEARVLATADRIAPTLGMDRRSFLKTSMGFAACFAAMNAVFGTVFNVANAQESDPEAAAEWAAQFADQFVFDGHLHFVHDNYAGQGILNVRRYVHYLGAPEITGDITIADIKFDNFVKEVFFDSDTTVGILTSATADNPQFEFISNAQMSSEAARLNELCGSRRLLNHALFSPGKDGWLDDVDRAIAELRPNSWKGYTVGGIDGISQFPWRLDDEELAYPAYERMVRAGITNVCIHKGLMPVDYRESMADVWRYATVEDLPKAARDWPEINFIIYHAAFAPSFAAQPEHIQHFEETGEIDWVTQLAAIPEEHGVSNVYADLGATFATTCVSYPRHAAALVSTLVRGLGADHVLWGTDSVWYGSPQWQIEALRRMEVPQDLQERFGLPALGEGRSAIKEAILGGNSARLYGLTAAEATKAHYAGDRLSGFRAQYVADGADPSNATYGFLRRE